MSDRQPDWSGAAAQGVRHEAAARISGAVEAVVSGHLEDVDPMLDGIESLPLSETLSAWQWLADAAGRWGQAAGVRFDLNELMDAAGLPNTIRPTLRELTSLVSDADATFAGQSTALDPDDGRATGRGELIGGAVLLLLHMLERIADETRTDIAVLVDALPAYGVDAGPTPPG